MMQDFGLGGGGMRIKKQKSPRGFLRRMYGNRFDEDHDDAAHQVGCAPMAEENWCIWPNWFRFNQFF